MDIYVLDKNLEAIGVIDSYRSLIWANRYNTIGDCELYLEASVENLELLMIGRYLTRYDEDDTMTCRIKKIELDTDAEAGNYLIVTGSDCKDLFEQRIIWDMMNANGNIEDFIREIIDTSCINPEAPERKLLKDNGDPLIQLGTKANLTEVTTEQVTYKNVGEKIREYCQTNQWGYRMDLSNEQLLFELYKGADRSGQVFFSDQYENLSSSQYVDDATNIGNVALVAGVGEGTDREKSTSGYAESLDRYEIYVDAKDIAQSVTWEELTTTYPTQASGGKGYIASSGSGYVYKMTELNIQIVDAEQLAQLKIDYPNGQEITIDGADYYQVYNVTIADIPSDAPQSEDTVELRPILYSLYLINRGYEMLAEYGEVVTFQGSIIPDVTFVYKQDYFLGDIVSVENEYGIKADARIVEIVEVNDENGYSVEPKFEYLDSQSAEPQFTNYYIESEQSKAPIETEAGDRIITEQLFRDERSAKSLRASLATVENGVKVSELEDIGAISKTDLLYVASNGHSNKADFSTIIDFIYPIGSYYETSDGSFDPNVSWGGTWELEAEGQTHVGAGANYVLGATGGEASVTLTASQSGLPAHHHSMNHGHSDTFKLKVANPNNTGTLSTSQLTYGRPEGTTYTNANAISGGVSNYTGNTGDVTAADASSSHNNMPPYVAVNRWHRTA